MTEQDLAREEKFLEEITLISLFLSSWEEEFGAVRAWKGHLFEILDRLEEQGLITQSKRAKSLYLTGEGVEQARALQDKYQKNL